MIVNEAFPVLVKVVVRTGLVWPTLTLPKQIVVGLSVRMPAGAVTVTVALAEPHLSLARILITTPCDDQLRPRPVRGKMSNGLPTCMM